MHRSRLHAAQQAEGAAGRELGELLRAAGQAQEELARRQQQGQEGQGQQQGQGQGQGHGHGQHGHGQQGQGQQGQQGQGQGHGHGQHGQQQQGQGQGQQQQGQGQVAIAQRLAALQQAVGDQGADVQAATAALVSGGRGLTSWEGDGLAWAAVWSPGALRW